MAFTGLKHVYAARIKSENDGQPVVYGEGVKVGKLVRLEVTWTRNSNPLYADDAIAENDDGVSGGTVNMVTDDIEDAARAVIMNETKITGEDGANDEYEENGDASPYIGLGYMRTRRKDGVNSYVCFLIHKTQLGIASESAETKSESITWQNPNTTGPVMAVHNTADRKNNFRRRVEFANEADAVAWLKKKLNVPDELIA